MHCWWYLTRSRNNNYQWNNKFSNASICVLTWHRFPSRSKSCSFSSLVNSWLGRLALLALSTSVEACSFMLCLVAVPESPDHHYHEERWGCPPLGPLWTLLLCVSSSLLFSNFTNLLPRIHVQHWITDSSTLSLTCLLAGRISFTQSRFSSLVWGEDTVLVNIFIILSIFFVKYLSILFNYHT